MSGGTRPGGPRLPGLALSRSAVDRAAEHRTDDEWLAAAWDSPKVAVVRTSAGTAAVAGDRVPGDPTRGDPTRGDPTRGDPTRGDPTRGDPVALNLDVRPDVAPGRRLFLGVDGDVPFFAVEVDDPDETFRSLREIGLLLDARDAGLVVHAISVANWHTTHTHCPRCGAPTRTASAGHTRVCDVDGTEHYPRTDPAVIMAVVDDGDRLLLGRQAAWPERRFSTLAGFVEPGESLEQAVRREVGEEVGLEIGEVDYLGSQPWPFPASLMLGFVARARTTEVHRRDGEIAEARWFTRDGLIEDVRRGEVLLSPPLSIARRLIEHWYGEPVEDALEAWR